MMTIFLCAYVIVVGKNNFSGTRNVPSIVAFGHFSLKKFLVTLFMSLHAELSKKRSMFDKVDNNCVN